MAEPIREHLKSRTTWIRGLYMLLFALLYGIAELLVLAVALFQFITVLITGAVNERLLPLGRGLSVYIYQVMLYLTYGTEEKPFPFSPWPRGPLVPSMVPETTAGKTGPSTEV
jgi:hypothetical protein